MTTRHTGELLYFVYFFQLRKMYVSDQQFDRDELLFAHRYQGPNGQDIEGTIEECFNP